MNSMKNAALTSLAIANHAANPEYVRGGLVAAAGKVGELAGAAPAAAGKARCPHAHRATCFLFTTNADQ